MYIDLHVHSVFSDGTWTPRQMAQRAREANVSCLALADHNTTAGSDGMRIACDEYGISCINAVEIDSIFEGEDLHILSYGADKAEPSFARLVRGAREALDQMSDRLIIAMQADGRHVSYEEYLRYPEQRERGGWKALHYLLDCGACASEIEVFGIYDTYGITYVGAGFPAAEDVLKAIHGAGGKAVLAHPGDSSRRKAKPSETCDLICRLFSLGLDGAECYYPKHSPEESELYKSVCVKNKRIVTSGSDCHGTFSGAPVGSLKTAMDDVCIEQLRPFIIAP